MKKSNRNISANARRVAKHAAKQNDCGKKRISIWASESSAALVRAWLLRLQKFETALKVLNEENRHLPLAKLSGTFAQIKWAEQIRAERISILTNGLSTGCDLYCASLSKDLNHTLNPLDVLQIIKSAYGECRASWWIDTRHYSFTGFLEAVYRRNQHPCFRQPDRSDEVIDQALIDTTLRPTKRVTGPIAEVSIDNLVVRIAFAEFTENGNKHLKVFGFEFQKPYWERTLMDAGQAANCAVEVAARLLADGHPVRIMDDELRDRVISNDYVPENLRRIKLSRSDKYGVKFMLLWDPRESHQSSWAVREIKGAKLFRKGGGAFVPLSCYEAIEDMIEHSKFCIDQEARTALEQERSKYEAMLRVKPRRRRPKLPEIGSLPPPNTACNGGIDAELVDD